MYWIWQYHHHLGRFYVKFSLAELDIYESSSILCVQCCYCINSHPYHHTYGSTVSLIPKRDSSVLWFVNGESKWSLLGCYCTHIRQYSKSYSKKRFFSSGGRLLHDGETFRSRKGFRRFLMKPKSFALFFLEPVSLCFHADNRLLISADELAILYNSAVVFFILENLWISFGKKISLVICLRKNQRRKSFQEIFICF